MILVLGKNGQLGFAMEQVFREKGDEVVSFGKDVVDITNPIEIRRIVEKYSPNIIINCAAYNQVEIAPSNIDQAFKVNAFGPYWIAQEAEAVNALFIHISTDYVFDGKKNGFSEADCPKPINVYGASKLAGEQLVRLANKNSYIIRTSWLFGKNTDSSERNFVRTMILKAKETRQIKVVDDQIGSPTYANDLAKKIYELLKFYTEPGIYHITNSGHCSWYELAKKIFELAKIEIEVIPIKTGDSGTKIKRPNNSVLENKRLREINLPVMRAWQDALNDYIKEIL